MNAGTDLVARFTDIIVNPTILIIFALGFFLFVFGLVEFMWSLSSGAENNEGKNHMIWGIAGMLVMVSVWGIIGLLENTFGIGRAGGTDISRLENVTAPANFGGQQ